VQILIKEDRLTAKVKEIGKKISEDYRNLNPVMIGVMNGSFMFLSDLLKAIDIPVEVDFVSVASYDGTGSSGKVKLFRDISSDIKDRHIIIVEDIVDTGQTVSFLIEHFNKDQPTSIAVCSLLNKKDGRKVDVKITYLGFDIPNVFVIGYGLDQSNNYRNLNYIGVFNDR
jgi:hypoxanthine phosphoribosyltransferase